MRTDGPDGTGKWLAHRLRKMADLITKSLLNAPFLFGVDRLFNSCVAVIHNAAARMNIFPTGHPDGPHGISCRTAPTDESSLSEAVRPPGASRRR